MQRGITPLWGEKKVVLRQTPRAVTPFGGLSVFVEFLGKIGFADQGREHLPVHLKSPNAIPSSETFTAFLIAGVVGARRFVVVRELLRETKRSLGRKLFEGPGYTFRIFVTNRPDPPEEIWRDYNQRACVEQRIEGLKSGLAADDFCLREFFATEAAFLAILMLFNLLAEFQRAVGMNDYRQPASLRFQVFLCGALLGRAGHRTVLHLSAAWGGPQRRNPLWDKLLLYEIPTSPKLVFQPLAGG